MVHAMSKRKTRGQSPLWYRRRSAIFALVFAIGFLGGWAISYARLRRYEPAFASVGSHWGSHGVLIAALAAIALIATAMAVRVWGSSYLSAPTVWDEDAHTETLIVAGPFRFVRHPLYLGNMLLALGFGAAAPLFGWAFIVIADALFIRVLIVYEDRRLAACHGENFATYRREVRAMFPRLPPVPANQAVAPSPAQGLSAESFTMFLLAGVIGLFAVPRYGAFVLAACYAAGIFVQRRIERE